MGCGMECGTLCDVERKSVGAIRDSGGGIMRM